MVKRANPMIDDEVAPELELVLSYFREQVQLADTTQRDLSLKLGLSRDYIHQVLRGHVDLKLAQVLRLAFLLGITPEDMYTDLATRSRLSAGKAVRMLDELATLEIEELLEKSLVSYGLLPAGTKVAKERADAKRAQLKRIAEARTATGKAAIARRAESKAKREATRKAIAKKAATKKTPASKSTARKTTRAKKAK